MKDRLSERASLFYMATLSYVNERSQFASGAYTKNTNWQEIRITRAQQHEIVHQMNCVHFGL